ncbi:DUF916 and DUF3324 domain-containing protein [Enterococcus sp. AZ128]|uniref:DUF916 and DUF3324 domain-containing protein n=1 Tax=unclassified Enterococcus TaxID=2608891 RepID=UPI003F682991
MTRRKMFRYYSSFFLLFCISLCFPLFAQAEEESQGPAGYTVESVLPENQFDKRRTFFYLKMEPSQKQTIQVKVISTQKEPVTVHVAVHDAVSSSVGAIDYAQDKPKLDNSLKQPITSFVNVKDNVKEVTVKNYEEKIVDFEINMPKDAFSGVKLGSVRFLRKADDKDKKKTGLVPEYARVIALMLTEDEETFNHGADLHLKKVDVTVSHGRKVVAANIQNNQPKVLQDMKINGVIKKKGEKKTFVKHEMEKFSVAPNSNFDFEIPLGLERFLPGTYVFTGTATGDGRTWKWEEEFTIGKDQADKVNEETVYKILVPSWVPWAGAALVIALIGLIGYLIRRQKQWQEQSHERK